MRSPLSSAGPARGLSLLVSGVTLLLAADLAPAAEFVIVSGDKRNSVLFESKAPAESFEGKSSKIAGRVECDPANLGDSLSVSIEVDAASLDTGIGLRNEHMRKNHLHTDQFPKIEFTGVHLLPTGMDAAKTPRPAALVAGQAVSVAVAGTFTLHGVSRRIEAPAIVTWNTEGGRSSLRIVSKFQIHLADYSIPRPQFLVMKLDEIQRITFDVVAEAR